MEFIQQEARTHIALAALQQSSSADHEKPVYNATTVPVGLNNKDVMMNNGRVTTLNNGSSLSSGSESFKFSNFTNLPSREPVDLQFKDVSYTVKLGFNKGTKEILHKVNGWLPGSQMTAIMGPSGAGKSTLLDVLSGYRISGINGAVYLNGRIRNLDTFRKMSCYITQEDRIQGLLTVLENMRIAAEFKLGNTMDKYEKEGRIEEILTVLGLYHHQNTPSKQLSGGQRKRLSIALELINNPTIMFLDEPTSGLDTHSCNQVVHLLKQLAGQGRTIICTIHQPSAKLFQEFEQVYVLAKGMCMYQGYSDKIVPYLQTVQLPCPMYHNPADYIIELACGEYGEDKINVLVDSMENGECTDWFREPTKMMKLEELRQKYPLSKNGINNAGMEAVGSWNQLKILIKRGIIKGRKDSTLTHLRIIVNIIVALMLGALYVRAGDEGSRVLDNYNLLFAILLHNTMTSMMLTVLTFPIEMGILLKEHFNRWYSLKMYYTSVTLLDLPISIVSCLVFTIIIYILSSQPLEWFRFSMFFTISFLITIVGQSLGLMIGAWFGVVNGTFLGSVVMIPMMMFAGFGVTLRDLPSYLRWGSHISFLRYGLEGFVCSIYGENRGILACDLAPYCHYKYPKTFLHEISMKGDQFWNDVTGLLVIILILRVGAYLLLRLKIRAVR